MARHFLIDTDTASDDAIALQPEVATETKSFFVAIEAQSELCRGQSVVDHFGVLGREPNAEVVLKASREMFLQMLFDAVRSI